MEAIAALAAIGAGCGTTTTAGGGNSARWLDAHRGDPADVLTEGPDGSAELRHVRIVSISPTEVQLQSTSGEVVLPDRVRAIRVSEPWIGMLQGGGVGLAVGLAGGIAVIRKPDPPDCDTCSVKPMAAMLLVSGGIILGMLIGAALGHDDVLTF